MDIIKVSHRTDLSPQTLVQVLEDRNATWAVTEPVARREHAYNARLIASSIHYPDDSRRDQRYIHDLEGNLAFKVDIHNKTISADHSHPAGRIRHVDHIEEWAYITDVIPIAEVLRQFLDCGYKLI